MKALLTGERVGTVLEVAILVAVLLGASVSVLMVLLYRGEVQRAQLNERHAQIGEYQLCLERERYDRANHALEQADADLMHGLIQMESRLATDKGVHGARVQLFQAKVDRDEAYLATPVVDGCELIKP